MIALFAHTLIFLIAILHLWFFILEMFLWQKPIGLKTFRINAQFAKESAALAANQGLYNGFLSVGLFWSLCTDNLILAYSLKIFFLGCVLVAGLYAGFTVNRRIFYIQGLPAAIALALLQVRAG